MHHFRLALVIATALALYAATWLGAKRECADCEPPRPQAVYGADKSGPKLQAWPTRKPAR